MDKDAAALVLQARHRQCVEELFDDYAEDFDEHLTSLGLKGKRIGWWSSYPWTTKMMNLMMTMMKKKVMTIESVG